MIFCHFKKRAPESGLEDFISTKPALASQAAELLFDFLKYGKNGRLMTDLSMAIEMGESLLFSAALQQLRCFRPR